MKWGPEILAVLCLIHSSCTEGSVGGEGIPKNDPSRKAPLEGSGQFLVKNQVGYAELAAFKGDPNNSHAAVIHFNLPVPKNDLPNANDWYAILDYDGTPVAAQLEIATRYPTGEPSIRELIAQVHRDPNISPGTTTGYAVHKIQFTQGGPPTNASPKNLDPIVDRIFNHPSRGFSVRIRDVFGNEYLAPLLPGMNRKFLKKGEFLATTSTYMSARPNPAISGSKGTVPDLIGVHAFVTVKSGEPALEIDLHFNNGQIGTNTTTPNWKIQKTLYFKDIQLVVPKGFTVDQDVANPGSMSGPHKIYHGFNQLDTYDIVAARPDGKPHVMEEMSQFVRRIAVSIPGGSARGRALLDKEGIAFCQPGMNQASEQFYSWWNPNTARYYPQSYVLPSLDYHGKSQIENKLQSKFNTNASAIQNGSKTNLWVNGPLGAFFPMDAPYGGVTGGGGMYQIYGLRTAYAASNPGYRNIQLEFRGYVERMPNALWNADGSPINAEQFLRQGSSGFQYIPYSLWYDKPGNNTAREFFGCDTNKKPTDNAHSQYVKQNNLQPPYEGALMQYSPIDVQHYTRFSRTVMALVYLGNDAMARHELEWAANQGMMSWLMHYKDKSKGSSQLLKMLLSGQNNPGQGNNYGRGLVRSHDVVNAAYAIGSDSFRSRVKPWINMVVDMGSFVQIPCTGALQAWFKSGKAQSNENQTKWNESSLIPSALRGAVENVFEGVDPGREALANAQILALSHFMVGPYSWRGNGPYAQVAVGPLAKSAGMYCTPPTTNSGLHHDQSWPVFAYAYDISKDKLFLTRAMEQGGGTMSALKNYLQKTSGTSYNLWSYSPTLALFQSLGWKIPGP